MTDQKLVERIQTRDEAAFEEFVNKYQEMVLNVCNQFIHNKDDAMDVAQEVFIKVYESITNFKSQSKISTWLYRIAVNKSLNFLRNKKRKSIFSSLDLLFENPDHNPAEKLSDEDPDSQEKMEMDEDKQILMKVINKLPEKQKTAITLNKFEKLPYKDIAEIMNISVTETGVLINRAKNKIQKEMIQYFKHN
ncbi:MAG: RNA polymerase sigma factor [Bacteroidales bacterium]